MTECNYDNVPRADSKSERFCELINSFAETSLTHARWLNGKAPDRSSSSTEESGGCPEETRTLLAAGHQADPSKHDIGSHSVSRIFLVSVGLRAARPVRLSPPVSALYWD